MKMIKSAIRSFLKKINYLKNKNKIKEEYSDFLKTGKTSEEAYQRLINLYCASNGRFNEKMHGSISVARKSSLNQTEGENISSEVNNKLKTDGYAILTTKLSTEICDELYRFASGVKCKAGGVKEEIIYDELNPVSEIYRLKAEDMMNNEVIQDLITNKEFINIAAEYLNCEPIFDFPAMWWSTSFSREASGEAAQLYHFDMDRVKWLKIFFYLSDVDEDNGPHCYISGSHQVGTKPQHLLDRGYVRIPDIDLNSIYPAESFRELKASKGTIFFGDTSCWHKGKPLRNGHRLVLEFQYTSSLFGINYPLFCTAPTPAFKTFMAQNKIYASNIHFE